MKIHIMKGGTVMGELQQSLNSAMFQQLQAECLEITREMVTGTSSTGSCTTSTGHLQEP